MSVLSFTVQGKPIPLPRSRSAASKRPYIPRTHPVHGWQKAVWVACHEEILRRKLGKPCFQGKVTMSVWAWGVRANADLDNVFKAIADALIGEAYIDDCQIRRLNMDVQGRDCDGQPPGIQVEITEYQGDYPL